MSGEDLMKADQPCGRGWFHGLARPMALWVMIVVLPFAVLSPDIPVEKLGYILSAIVFLCVFRGMIDKDGLARMLGIWKGQGQ